MAKNPGAGVMVVSPHPPTPLSQGAEERRDRPRGHSATPLLRADNGTYAVLAGRFWCRYWTTIDPFMLAWNSQK